MSARLIIDLPARCVFPLSNAIQTEMAWAGKADANPPGKWTKQTLADYRDDLHSMLCALADALRACPE